VELKENQHYVVEVDGEPLPSAGLYRSRSGANKKRRTFLRNGATPKRITVGIWECVGPLSWKKVRP
jgi:hypothetical protein